MDGIGTRGRVGWVSLGAARGASAVARLVVLSGGCYPRADFGPAHRAPLPAKLVLPTPAAVYAPAESATEAAKPSGSAMCCPE